ncbi:MAG: hypothetical protein JHD02_01065 [Thermoleophilaceae bacterium]|nr:hypothetical protein [Thermoleophilaceae bacterium]
MEFKRRFRASSVFECDSGEGPYRFVRPSGTRTTRKALDLRCAGRDFEIRTDKEKVWFLEGDTTIGFGASQHHRWQLVIAGQEYVLDQPSLGVNHSTVEDDDGHLVAQIRGVGFPIARVELINAEAFTADQQAFLAMVATLSWRESDRRLVGGTTTAG